MRKTAAIIIISLLFIGVGFKAAAAKEKKMTGPSIECKNTSDSIIKDFKADGAFPGKWTVKGIEYHVGRTPFIRINLKKAGKPDLTLVVMPLKNSEPLLASTKYFTIGFRTEKKSGKTDPEIEAATLALAEIVKKNESKKLDSDFRSYCSKTFVPSKISNSIFTTRSGSLFRGYDGEIAAAFAAAKAVPPHGLWSSVYVSRYLVFCPVVVFSLAVLLAVYVKLFSKKSI